MRPTLALLTLSRSASCLADGNACRAADQAELPAQALPEEPSGTSSSAPEEDSFHFVACSPLSATLDAQLSAPEQLYGQWACWEGDSPAWAGLAEEVVSPSHAGHAGASGG